VKVFDAEATRERLPFGQLIPALREAFVRGAAVPPRQVLELGAATSLLMPAWDGAHYAVKVVNVAPGNAAQGLPSVHASVLLYDAATGVPLALIDGGEVTARRTVAASALAALLLARADASKLLVVGGGRLARLLPLAYREVRPLEAVRVWARSPAQAESVAAAWRALGLAADVAPSLEAGVRWADIVSCATLATEPLIEDRWLRPGMHLDLIGSFTPAMREADDACLHGAAVVVDTEEALLKSGDLASFDRRHLRGTLASTVRGETPARRSADERTVFKSVGTALEDLAAAVLVLRG
jgi:ornithine cyclodeaminase